MIRRHQRSTLFPYTTLFRSWRRSLRSPATPEHRALRNALHDSCKLCATRAGEVHRSEEHTSELQSRQYLVCRLLLEKKKEGSPLWWRGRGLSAEQGHATA